MNISSGGGHHHEAYKILDSYLMEDGAYFAPCLQCQCSRSCLTALYLGYSREEGEWTPDIYGGNEHSEWAENKALDWHLLQHKSHKGVQTLIRDLMQLYRSEPALFERDYDAESFEWIDLSDRRPGLFSFIRKAKDPANHLFFILNFGSRKIDGYTPGPFEGLQYELAINTDSGYYGGMNLGGHGGKGRTQTVWLAPFSGLILKSVLK